MTNYPAGKSVRVTVQPEVSKDLSNATKLRNEMRSQLREVQSTKPDIVKYQPRGSE